MKCTCKGLHSKNMDLGEFQGPILDSVAPSRPLLYCRSREHSKNSSFKAFKASRLADVFFYISAVEFLQKNCETCLDYEYLREVWSDF